MALNAHNNVHKLNRIVVVQPKAVTIYFVAKIRDSMEMRYNEI